MKRYLWVILLLPLISVADDVVLRSANPTSVIESSICVPDITGQKCLHVDEDVSGLVIKVIAEDGTTISTYDDPTEIEDVAVIGTYAAPSANNVRASPQANGGADLTQIMLPDADYSAENRISMCISDGGTTIMDFCRTIDMAMPADRITSISIQDNALTAGKAAINFIDADELGSGALAEINAQVDTALTDYDGPTDAEMDARTILAANYFDPAADAVANVTLVATTTTNTDLSAHDGKLDTVDGNVDLTLADTNELQTDDIPGLIAALNDPTVAEIWNEVCEDQGATYTCRDVMSLLLAEAMGTCVYTTGTRTWVCSDPSGTETRFTLVYGAELDGDRTTSTPAPLTP